VLDVLIVGGGIHGTHLAAQLIAQGRVTPEGLAIVDPAPALLHRWRQCTANTGMDFLRSPAVHHLDVDPFSLREHAGCGGRRRRSRRLFAAPYGRPALSLFNEHCDGVIERYGLQRCHVQARAADVFLDDGGARVVLDTGDMLLARNVILAVGSSEQPVWPRWASDLRADGALIHHIFEQGFHLDPADLPHRVAVVGSGISGAQVALRLADAGHEVQLVSRRTPEVHHFDSDPGWIGPKNMRRFAAEPSLKRRRQMIGTARHRGSVPPAIAKRLRQAVAKGTLHWRDGDVLKAWRRGGVHLAVGMDLLEVDGVLLATGFDAKRPGGAMVDRMVARHGLPCAECGYPVVDESLRWHAHLAVSGPLAELMLGPVSRNIVGARRAAERILRGGRFTR